MKVDGKETAQLPLVFSTIQQKNLVQIHAHAVAKYNIYSLDVLEIKNISFLYLILSIFPAPTTTLQYRLGSQMLI